MASQYLDGGGPARREQALGGSSGRFCGIEREADLEKE